MYTLGMPFSLFYFGAFWARTMGVVLAKFIVSVVSKSNKRGPHERQYFFADFCDYSFRKGNRK